jgi:hypothetical protein
MERKEKVKNILAQNSEGRKPHGREDLVEK